MSWVDLKNRARRSSLLRRYLQSNDGMGVQAPLADDSLALAGRFHTSGDQASIAFGEGNDIADIWISERREAIAFETIC